MNARWLIFNLLGENLGLLEEEARRLVALCPNVADSLLEALESGEPLLLETDEERGEVVAGLEALDPRSDAADNIGKLLEAIGACAHA